MLRETLSFQKIFLPRLSSVRFPQSAIRLNHPMNEQANGLRHQIQAMQKWHSILRHAVPTQALNDRRMVRAI